MKNRGVSAIYGVFLGACLLIVLFIPNRIMAYDFDGWSHGASGHNNAIQEARSEEKPFILYFHTAWCKWSKKMNHYYLDSYNVKGFLEDIPKVEINPDRGADEKALCRKYRVTGYPFFLVTVPAIENKTTRLYPFKKYADWTTDELIRAIGKKIGAVYNKRGFSCYQ